MIALLYLLLFLLPPGDLSPFDQAVNQAGEALAEGRHAEAWQLIERAAERDPKSQAVWELWARWAEAVQDRDEQIYALHRLHRLAVAQKASRMEQNAIRARLETVDPIAPDLLDLRMIFVEKLEPVAQFYEKEGRPHSAIHIHQEILTLDPEWKASEEAIERISSAPDPSLAGSAKPRDLFADVSREWIKKYDEKHSEWSDRGKLKSDHYFIETDAGYEVMVRTSEAMEQLNAFYRIFFNYGTKEDGRTVTPLDLRIFRDKDEYLKYGQSPAAWSGGQFTGSAVETFVGGQGFDGMIGTLFHEASHQFVKLATNAAGITWLNEGMATYFEGTRILANGTVQMNLPANGRLFPLVTRMEKGWMIDHKDGIELRDPNVIPPRAPRMETVIANQYQWGPAWYAPVWGVTYFFFNYQDPLDGRFFYRKAFRAYVNQVSGRVGEGAVENIEEMVLKVPEKPTPGVDFSQVASPVKLPKTVRDLNPTWKQWLLDLRDQQSGKKAEQRPYHAWAKYAVKRGDKYEALEHYEKALVENPEEVTLLVDMAKFLALKFKNTDRAAKLILLAIQEMERSEEVDDQSLDEAQKLLAKWDPKWRALERIHGELRATARSLALRYLDEDLNKMVMDVAWRLGTELNMPELMPLFEEAVRQSGKSLWLWTLAYNERDLEGWRASGQEEIFSPQQRELHASLETYSDDNFNYQFLTLDKVTSGDFSMETEVYAERGQVSFCGLVFGKKQAQNYHAVILYPGGADPKATGRSTRTGYVDLTSFYGSDNFKIWRHSSLGSEAVFPGWHTLRVDVAGKMVDVWCDGRLITSHEFPTTQVVRGEFGLVTGAGKARFRNVRFLSRPGRDPGARIERKIKMERLEKESLAEGGGGTRDGSWLEKIPPFPENVVWIQSPRQDWEEQGPVPSLVVLFSIQQNNLMPLHEWLVAVAEQYKDVGLRIVCVASAEDMKAIKPYLENQPFPGSVCVDRYVKRNSYGATFEQYGIKHFNLPRLLLMDINHRVVWEGDPGFRVGSAWKPGEESYLDGPMDDLLSQRKLIELFRWRNEWAEWGEEALLQGDLARVGRLLVESRSFDPKLDPEIKKARRRFDRLEAAIGGLATTAASIAKSSCEPALQTLLDWGEGIGVSADPTLRQALKSMLKGKHAQAWTKALGLVDRSRGHLTPETALYQAELLVERLAPLSGHFVIYLRESLNVACLAGDRDRAQEIIEQARQFPASWLAEEFFQW